MPTVVPNALAAQTPRKVRHAAVSGFFGSALEYYDFIIYGSAAALVFNKIFFPDTGATGLLLSIASFGVAYIARPFGAVLWGHLGDKLGRRLALVLTIGLMGVATFAIGLLPSYSTIGVAAPSLLVLLRLLQGLSAGGESPGSTSLTVEHAPDNRRAFYASFSMSGMQLGMAMGSLVFLPIAALPEEHMLTWGWRLPFLLSGILTLVAYLLRRKLEEPEVFTEMLHRDEHASLPIATLLREHWATTLRVALCSGINVVGTIFNVFALAYATGAAGLSRPVMLTVVSLGNLGAAAMAPVVGRLSDRIGRKPVFVLGALGSSLSLFVLFSAIDAGNITLVFIAGLTAMSVFYIMPIGVGAAYYPEQFPARVRYTGMAVGLMLGLLGAGFAPTLAQAISVGTSSWRPSVWICVGIAVLASIAALTGRETHRITTAQLGRR
ncbi:MFS transporter [Saccharopolyspora sp. ASAGF58]|uniref:MFS transporter n=1 Tax=Saccharopolyspora sp. ASAGF58 TaxID=2719023 RepID=UPI00143FCDE6|nr:MFS transporter [Saccharopolyspora sp. ASAGF58]QIZ37188.1 MHS family MFS transporter [Saccharopolyspora sp. ASAGF58]